MPIRKIEASQFLFLIRLDLGLLRSVRTGSPYFRSRFSPRSNNGLCTYGVSSNPVRNVLGDGSSTDLGCFDFHSALSRFRSRATPEGALASWWTVGIRRVGLQRTNKRDCVSLGRRTFVTMARWFILKKWQGKGWRFVMIACVCLPQIDIRIARRASFSFSLPDPWMHFPDLQFQRLSPTASNPNVVDGMSETALEAIGHVVRSEGTRTFTFQFIDCVLLEKRWPGRSSFPEGCQKEIMALAEGVLPGLTSARASAERKKTQRTDSAPARSRSTTEFRLMYVINAHVVLAPPEWYILLLYLGRGPSPVGGCRSERWSTNPPVR